MAIVWHAWKNVRKMVAFGQMIQHVRVLFIEVDKKRFGNGNAKKKTPQRHAIESVSPPKSVLGTWNFVKALPGIKATSLSDVPVLSSEEKSNN